MTTYLGNLAIHDTIPADMRLVSGNAYSIRALVVAALRFACRGTWHVHRVGDVGYLLEKESEDEIL